MNIGEFALENDAKYPDQPHGWIQWKGTSVCMDVHCTCGYSGHVDVEFFYYYECVGCKRRYAVGSTVKLTEVPPELYSQLDGHICKHSDDLDCLSPE